MSDYVLVHGALMGSWCWERIAAPLRAAGHRVDAVDLPGSDGDLAVLTGVQFEDYVSAVVDVAERYVEPIFVGHSFGGLTVSAAARRTGVARIVYVAAFAPTPRRPAAADLLALPEAADEGLRSALVVTGSPPVATISPRLAHEILYQDASAIDAAQVSGRLTPHPTWLSGVPAVDSAQHVPTTYVVCARDRAVPPALQRRMAREVGAEPVVELDADHCPFITAPEQLARALSPAGSAPSTDPARDAYHRPSP